MIDIISWLPSRYKLTSSGWYSFNSVCCHHRGEKPDKRQRGGIKLDAEGGFAYSCFNCNFKTAFKPGRPLSFKTRRFLEWLGVDSSTIEHINLESLKYKNIHGLLEESQSKIKRWQPNFKDIQLSNTLRLIDSTDTKEISYLDGRGIEYNSYPFMVDSKAIRPGIVIPYTYDHKIVGHTTRFLDDRKPKYLNESQEGFVFGIDLQSSNWQYVIVVEGVFDALSINGVALLHSDVNEYQAEIIRSLNKEVIFVPDMDKTGLKLIDKAIQLGWSVSMPHWSECKDVNDAIKKYGRLATIMSIVQSKETSKIKIEMRRKQVAKRL